MAKASLTLHDGTTVLIEGSPEEIEKIIAPHRSSEYEKREKVELKKTSVKKDRKMGALKEKSTFPI